MREGEILSSGGVWLHYRAWSAPRAQRILAIVHGLGEHGGRYAETAAWLSQRGTSVWAIDLRGMGRSEGPRGRLGRWTDWLDDARRLCELAAEQEPGLEVIPMGHSLGGVVVASAVLRGVLQPARFVLSNPAFRIRASVPPWKRALGAAAARAAPNLSLPSGIDVAGLAIDPRVGEAYLADPWVHDRLSAGLYGAWMRASRDVMTRAPRLHIPYLLLLSPEDPIIDARASEDFVARTNGEHQVRRYADRWHEPLHDFGRETVFADLDGWLSAGSTVGA